MDTAKPFMSVVDDSFYFNKNNLNTFLQASTQNAIPTWEQLLSQIKSPDKTGRYRFQPVGAADQIFVKDKNIVINGRTVPRTNWPTNISSRFSYSPIIATKFHLIDTHTSTHYQIMRLMETVSNGSSNKLSSMDGFAICIADWGMMPTDDKNTIAQILLNKGAKIVANDLNQASAAAEFVRRHFIELAPKPKAAIDLNIIPASKFNLKQPISVKKKRKLPLTQVSVNKQDKQIERQEEIHLVVAPINVVEIMRPALMSSSDDANNNQFFTQKASVDMQLHENGHNTQEVIMPIHQAELNATQKNNFKVIPFDRNAAALKEGFALRTAEKLLVAAMQIEHPSFTSSELILKALPYKNGQIINVVSDMVTAGFLKKDESNERKPIYSLIAIPDTLTQERIKEILPTLGAISQALTKIDKTKKGKKTKKGSSVRVVKPIQLAKNAKSSPQFDAGKLIKQLPLSTASLGPKQVDYYYLSAALQAEYGSVQAKDVFAQMQKKDNPNLTEALVSVTLSELKKKDYIQRIKGGKGYNLTSAYTYDDASIQKGLAKWQSDKPEKIVSNADVVAIEASTMISATQSENALTPVVENSIVSDTTTKTVLQPTIEPVAVDIIMKPQQDIQNTPNQPVIGVTTTPENAQDNLVTIDETFMNTDTPAVQSNYPINTNYSYHIIYPTDEQKVPLSFLPTMNGQNEHVQIEQEPIDSLRIGSFSMPLSGHMTTFKLPSVNSEVRFMDFAPNPHAQSQIVIVQPETPVTDASTQKTTAVLETFVNEFTSMSQEPREQADTLTAFEQAKLTTERTARAFGALAPLVNGL